MKYTPYLLKLEIRLIPAILYFKQYVDILIVHGTGRHPN